MLLLAGSLMLLSCSGMEQRFNTKKNALGKTNEITVIADDELWDSDIADSVVYYFGSAYPVMPQPEPVFDIRHFSVQQLQADELRRELRTYMVVADLSDEESPATKLTINAIGEEAVRKCREGNGYGTHLARDRWAQGQIIFFLYGFGDEMLARGIRRKYSAMASRISEHDRSQVDAATYLNGINGPLMDTLRQRLGMEMKIPGEYKLASSKDDILWLRAEYTESSHNLIITKVPYEDEEQFSDNYLQELRDSIVRRVVRTRTPGSVMLVNDKDLPLLFYEGSTADQYTKEMRGVWEMSDDYMGGPFISYLIISSDQKHLYFIDVWVYGPGKDKRDYMQRLEHIVSSIKI